MSEPVFGGLGTRIPPSMKYQSSLPPELEMELEML